MTMNSDEAKDYRITITLDATQLAQVDEHVERIRARAKSPRLQVSRTDAIRDALERGFAEIGRSR